MRKFFLTGLVVLLPIILTIVIVGFVFRILTSPFANTVAAIFDYYDIFNFPFLFLSSDQMLMLFSRVSVLLGLVVIVFLAGFFGRLFILKYLGRVGEYIIHRIPLVNKIYKSIHEIVNTLLAPSTPDTAVYSRVVLLPFPHSKTLSLGLITKGELPADSDDPHKQFVSVFVPGTPNPAMGFMLLFRREQLIPIDMTVEQALKFVVSIGVICPDFKASNKPPHEQC